MTVVTAPPDVAIGPDRLGRSLRDLRISVTDKCNFRCPYCMPKSRFGPGYRFLPRAEALEAQEIVRLAAVFQSPLVGSRFQVALPAELDCVLRSMKSAAKSAVTANDRMEREVALLSVMAGCCCMMIDFIGFAFSSPEINADFASES